MTEETTRAPFNEWAILELMGHRRVAGKVTEQEIAGANFIRIDVYGDDGAVATQFYSPQAVYAITPTTEEIARAVAVNSQPQPVSPWEIRGLLEAQPRSGQYPADAADEDEDEGAGEDDNLPDAYEF